MVEGSERRVLGLGLVLQGLYRDDIANFPNNIKATGK